MRTLDWYLKTPRVALAAREILQGNVIAYPTEGVWGLGCDPFDIQAVNRILDIKGREMTKGLILVCDRSTRLEGLVAKVPAIEDASSAGSTATTWLISHGGVAPNWITGGSSKIAVRVTHHPLVAAICHKAELPIVSTSANPAGKPAALSSMRVRKYFSTLVPEVDMIVPGPLGNQKGSSQIIDWETKEILRKAGA